MIDFKRTDDNDISFNTTTKDFDVVEDTTENVEQKVELRLKRFYGEYFLDTEKGIDYFNIVFIKNPDIEVINSAFKAEILKEPLIEEITSFDTEVNGSTRVMTINCSVRLTDGEYINDLEVVL